MSTVTAFAKCSCSSCGGHLEFETAYEGERVACPHCGKETCLCMPDSPGEQPSPSSPFGNYRQEDVTGPGAWQWESIAPPLPNPTRRSIDPAAFFQAAKTSWVAFLFAYFFSSIFDPNPPGELRLHRLIFGVTVVTFVVIGLLCGIFALRGIRKYGARGILTPAVVGIILNFLYFGVLVAGFSK